MEFEGKDKKRAVRMQRNTTARNFRRRLKTIKRLARASVNHTLHLANQARADAGQALIPAALIDNRFKPLTRKAIDRLIWREALAD